MVGCDACIGSCTPQTGPVARPAWPDHLESGVSTEVLSGTELICSVVDNDVDISIIFRIWMSFDKILLSVKLSIFYTVSVKDSNPSFIFSFLYIRFVFIEVI